MNGSTNDQISPFLGFATELKSSVLFEQLAPDKQTISPVHTAKKVFLTLNLNINHIMR